MQQIEKFYKEEYSRLIKLAYRSTKDVQGAEDIVQNAFENTMKYYHSFNPAIATFECWFGGILRSCTKAYFREQRLAGMTIEIKEDLIVTSETVGEDSKMVYEIRELVEKEPALLVRQICYLHFIEQYTPREIVKVVDTTSGYIRQTLCSFRKKLKKVYDE